MISSVFLCTPLLEVGLVFFFFSPRFPLYQLRSHDSKLSILVISYTHFQTLNWTWLLPVPLFWNGFLCLLYLEPSSSADKYIISAVTGAQTPFFLDTQENEFTLLSAPTAPCVGPLTASATLCHYIVLGVHRSVSLTRP